MWFIFVAASGSRSFILLLLCIVLSPPLGDSATIYLSVLLFLEIWIVFRLGLLWISLGVKKFFSSFWGIYKDANKSLEVSWWVTMLIKLGNCPSAHFGNVHLHRGKFKSAYNMDPSTLYSCLERVKIHFQWLFNEGLLGTRQCTQKPEAWLDHQGDLCLWLWQGISLSLFLHLWNGGG